MGFMDTTIGCTDPLREFIRREQTCWLDHAPFAMDPMRLDGIEPRTFHRQQTRHNPHAAVALDPLIVLANPLSDFVTAMPRGVVPDQQPRRLAHRLQPIAAPRQELRRDPADGPPIHEPQPESLPFRPEHPVARQRFGVGVRLGNRRLHEPQGLVVAPGVQRRLRHAAPPDFIHKAERPRGMGRCEADQPVTAAFFLA